MDAYVCVCVCTYVCTYMAGSWVYEGKREREKERGMGREVAL